MNIGDIVRNKNSESGELGLFIGLRTFKASPNEDQRQDYTCAEVMWFDRSAPNGERVGSIQTSLIEVANDLV